MSTTSGDAHVAVFPSAGMGHLTPSLRVAELLLRRCRVSLIVAESTVSDAESRMVSRFLSRFPEVTRLSLPLLPADTSAATDDPFWLQFDSLRRSCAAGLGPLLAAASPAVSALVLDVSLITPAASAAESLSIPAYVYFTSTARMLALFARFPAAAASPDYPERLAAVEIPGISPPVPRSSLPAPLLVPGSLFSSIFLADAPKLPRLRGVLVNSFDALEPRALEALRTGRAAEGFPPLFAVGPLPPCQAEAGPDAGDVAGWLDGQPEGSVVYVGFGSRSAVAREQMREIAEGLAESGERFLWVVKDKVVDREEEEGSLEDILGREVWERVTAGSKGLVVRHWVDQAEVLSHRAVGGFLSHCGSNSVVEAAMYGVRVLAWPLHGDQRVNAEVVRDCGFGIWVDTWGLSGSDPTAVEIAEKVRELMGSQELRARAAEIGAAAVEDAATREEEFDRLVAEWTNRNN